MTQVSRPMLIALVATVAFAGVWFVALRPKPSSGSAAAQPNAPGVAGLKRAVDKAHGAVATSNAATARARGGSSAPIVPVHPSTTPVPSAVHGPPGHVAAPPAHTAGGDRRVAAVQRALAQHRVLALLFYNPRASDDLAVRHELSGANRHHGRVVIVAAPLSELSRYAVVTKQVQVVVSPTLVIIDGQRDASTIVGFTDRAEINQRLADALAAGH